MTTNSRTDAPREANVKRDDATRIEWRWPGEVPTSKGPARTALGGVGSVGFIFFEGTRQCDSLCFLSPDRAGMVAKPLFPEKG